METPSIVLLQAIADGTWPWIVAGLCSVIAAIAGVYNKVQNDRIKREEAAYSTLNAAHLALIAAHKEERETDAARLAAANERYEQAMTDHAEELRVINKDQKEQIENLTRLLSVYENAIQKREGRPEQAS